MSDLPDHARSALDAFKATEAGASEATRARTWAAIESRAASGDLGPLLGAEEAPAAASTAAGWSPLLKGVALGVLGTSVIVGAWALGRGSAGPDTPPASQDVRTPVEHVEPPEPEPIAAPVATVTQPDPPPAAAVPEEEPAFDEPETPAVTRPRAVARKPGSSSENIPAAAVDADVDPLQAELALMARARAALKAEQHANAVKLLDEHAKRFPKGTFARERDLSRIRALCELGKKNRAKKIGRRYLEQEGSVMASKVQATCAAE